MYRLKFLISILIIATIILGYYSCQKDEIKVENEIISQGSIIYDGTLAEFNLPKCDRLESNSIYFNGHNISSVGKLHNQLLDSLLKIPFVFSDYINNDFISTSIFGLRFNEYYSSRDMVWFSNEIFNSEIKLKINKAYDDQIIEYKTKVFLTEIANSVLNNSFNTHHFINELNHFDPNSVDFLICATVLSITDYSNCYWNSNINNRWLPACLAFDCLAGIGQTIQNAYDSSQNGYNYDVDEWLRSAGKSAVWGSTLGRFGL